VATINTYTAVESALRDKIERISNRNMSKGVYDTNDNGIVDDSEMLGGQLPIYYLDWTHLINVPDDILNFETVVPFDGKFTSLTNKPTTLLGYGITDAFDGYFSSLRDKPTTIAGYGITDAFNKQYSSLLGLPTLINIYATPIDNQVAIWTNATTIEGCSNMSFSGGGLNIIGNISVTGTITVGSDPGPSFWQYMPTGIETVSDILQWNVNRYKPYTYQSPGRLYSTTTNPVSTTRLNYDGYFYATKVYSGGVEVVTGMTYPGAGIALSTGSAWDTPITNNSANWNTAYGWGDHAGVGYLTSVTAHNILSATHGDTLSDNVVRGDIIYGNSTPKWARLAFPSTPTGKVLQATADDIGWSSNPITIGVSASISGSNTGDQSLSGLGGQVQLVADIFDFQTNKYTPYAARSDGKFDSGTVDPNSSTRLNYDGFFYATSLRADTVHVGLDTINGTYGYFSENGLILQVNGHLGTFLGPSITVGNLSSPTYTANFINTYSTLTNNSAKVLSVRNNDTDAFQVTANGGIYSARNIIFDYDDNEYHTVIIGSQEWIVENLKVCHTAAGNDIPLYGNYNDWYLPSSSDLHEMYDVLHVARSIGDFRTGNAYWSSTEISATAASCVSFIDGTSGTQLKTGTFYIRACRSFTTTSSFSIGSRGPGGGWVFYKNGDNYLECAPCDNSTLYAWSNITSDYITGTVTDIGAGQANTTLIIGQTGHTSSAASYCDSLTSAILWTYTTKAAMCYYNDSTTNRNLYGALYNGYAVTTEELAYFKKNGIADYGWRVASNYDYLKLAGYLGGLNTHSGKALKEMGVSHWTADNSNATNSSGFTALPGGYRDYSTGAYVGINDNGGYRTTNSCMFYLLYNSSNFTYNGAIGNNFGFSVRCVRDVSAPSRGVEETMCISMSDETTDLTVGDGKATFIMPFSFQLNPITTSSTYVEGVKACVNTAPSNVGIIVDITNGGASIFSSLLQIDSGAKTSTSSGSPANMADGTILWGGSEIRFNIDQVGDVTAGKGLRVFLTGTRINYQD
jgi:uncharacterized protein (TIGR02145 family)